jgi:type VI secretion system secreted protein VgrG
MSGSRAANQDRFLFEISGKNLKVVDFSAREELSAPFEINLTLASEDEIEFDDVIQKKALLTVLGFESERYFNGIVSQFWLTGKIERFYLYRATVVPSLWLLSLEQDCRIFQEKDVKAIVSEVLQDGGIKSDRFDFRTKETHPKRDYCVQYRETDLNFISRLLEEEGIFYYFDHQKKDHLLIFSDSTVTYKPIAGGKADDKPGELSFMPASGLAPEKEIVQEITLSRQITTGKFTHRDYNFTKPSLKPSGQEEAKTFNKLEQYDYPGDFEDNDRGKALAKIRLEEARLFMDTAEGQSTCPRLLPGFTFKLIDHDDIAAMEKEYLLTTVSHFGAQPGAIEALSSSEGFSYGNQFIAIPSTVTYRPEIKTPKPYVRGIQSAFVTGPAAEEIYTDEHGRIKVLFHWDRRDKKNEKSSCWIRVSQLWAGAGWGAMHIPRVGHEVIVDFLEGDPDQPVVTGRLYHGTNKPPYTLPDHKTKSTIMSKTTPNGKTSNELVMEDKADETQVVLSNAYGHKLTMDEKDQFLSAETRDGNKITFDDKNKHIEAITTNNHKITFSDEKKKIILLSTEGHMLEIDDESQKMVAKTTNGHMITMDDAGEKIEVVNEIGGHSMVMNNKTTSITSGGGHTVTLDDGAAGNGIQIEDSSGNKILIDSASSKMVIEAANGIDLESMGDIKLKGANIELDATMNVKISGAMDVKSEAGITNEIKGTMVKADGAAMTDVTSAGKTTITGGIVMIN